MIFNENEIHTCVCVDDYNNHNNNDNDDDSNDGPMRGNPKLSITPTIMGKPFYGFNR